MPTEKPIDKDRLRELASDPNNSTKAVHTALGLSTGTFYTKLNNDPELKEIFTTARAAAREAKGLAPKTTKKGRKGGKKKGAKSSAPPPQGQCQSTQGAIREARA